MSATVPFWLDEPYEPRAALDGDVEADACVIGGGVAGLSCARRLAGHGVDTVLLERDVVAGGASGRNGGFLLAGMAAFHLDARERYGPERARAIYARTLVAQEEIYALAGELGAADSVRRTGALRVSTTPEEADHVRRHAEALHADGFPGRLLDRAELPPALRRGFLNGCLTDHDGAMQPARWIRALARAAEAAGARIHEGSAVEAPLTGAPTTARGRVRAPHVILAADGALPALVPEYADRVRARRLHMVATAPLPDRIAAGPVYARWGYEYFQQTPDGRLLAGGFSDLDGPASYTADDAGAEPVWQRVRDWLAQSLGAGLDITHRWVGTVGYTGDGLPVVEAVPGRPGLYVAGGYSGTGNVIGYVAGRELADRVAGAEDEAPVLLA